MNNANLYPNRLPMYHCMKAEMWNWFNFAFMGATTQEYDPFQQRIVTQPLFGAALTDITKKPILCQSGNHAFRLVKKALYTADRVACPPKHWQHCSTHFPIFLTMGISRRTRLPVMWPWIRKYFWPAFEAHYSGRTEWSTEAAFPTRSTVIQQLNRQLSQGI